MTKELFSPDELRFYARWEPVTLSFNDGSPDEANALLAVTVENKSVYDLRDFTAIVVRQPKSYIGQAFNALAPLEFFNAPLEFFDAPLEFFDAPPTERYLLRFPLINAGNALTDCPRMLADKETAVFATMKLDELAFLWVIPSRLSFILPSGAPYVETRGNPAWFSRNVPKTAKVPPQEVVASYRPNQIGLFTFNFPAP